MSLPWHGNKGRYHNILHGSTESAIPEKPLVGANISGLSTIQVDLCAIFLPKFHCHDNKGRPHNILHGSIESAIPENPPVGPNISGLSVIQAHL